MIRGMRILSAALLGLAAGAAQADLYLWKDPATGQVRIYSYPPPWYGNQELEKRSPKVERIPERQRAPMVEPEPGTAVPAAKPLPPKPGAPPAPPAGAKGLPVPALAEPSR